MPIFPFKFHEIKNKKLITNDAGDFFFCDEKNLKKLVTKKIDKRFKQFLLKKGFFFNEENDLYWNSHKFKIIKRKKLPDKISYFLIVPTLRCNLHCSYCQVSRVDEKMKGFDWNNNIINKFFEFIENTTNKKNAGTRCARFFGKIRCDTQFSEPVHLSEPVIVSPAAGLPAPACGRTRKT